jgi:anti-sigma-K factor RskA
MKNRGEYDSALAAEYALGTLRGQAKLRLEQRIRREPELAALVARWQELLSPLDRALMPITPPERVWKKILLNLPPASHQSRWRWDYLGWALAAGLAAVILVPRFITPPPEFSPAVVLTSSQTGSGQWIVSLDKAQSHLQLTPVNPPSIAAANSLQLWAIPAGGKPVSLGLIATQQATRLPLEQIQLSRGMTIAISLEPAGGSPTGQPTGPVLYSGLLASL